jgi:hypothetical protein
MNFGDFLTAGMTILQQNQIDQEWKAPFSATTKSLSRSLI